MLIGILLYKADGFLNTIAGGSGNLHFIDLLGKGIRYFGKQFVQIICILQFFRFLDEFIGKLIGGIIIQSAFDSGSGRQGSGDDNIVFYLSKGSGTGDACMKLGVICLEIKKALGITGTDQAQSLGFSFGGTIVI